MAMLPVTRATDADFPHCSGMERTPAGAAGVNVSVFAGGLPISREGDLNTLHLFPVGPFCFDHAVPILSASNSVFAQGAGCGRIFDPTCTAVAQGLPTVFVGDSFSDFF